MKFWFSVFLTFALAISLFYTFEYKSAKNTPGTLEISPVYSKNWNNCIKINHENSSKELTYIINRNENTDDKAIECRLTAQFMDHASDTVQVIIKNIPSSALENEEACNDVSLTPLDRKGQREALSDQFSHLSFESQIAMTLYVLGQDQCLKRMFPALGSDPNSVFKNLSMRSLAYYNKSGGYDLSQEELPTVVMPIAVLILEREPRVIACAKIVYNGQFAKIRHDESKVLQACLSNYSNISNFGENNA